MINKSKIISASDSDEIKLILSRACDLYDKAERTSKPFYTKFISPADSSLIYSRFPKSELSLRLIGGYDDAERCICAFYKYEDELYPPICALKFNMKSKTAEPTHRDYLGSLLSLGIKRETLGDIIVSEGGAIVFCLAEIADYIIDNLTKIGGSGVRIEIASDDADIVPKRQYEERFATVSSLRCDGVVSSVTGLSRAKAAELIERGLVAVNYNSVASQSALMKDGDVFSIRGYGKFRLQTDGRLSKKGRLHINLLKYI